MFRNHEGGREASHHHGELYKDLVRRYWEAREYDVVADSKDDSITSDLIVRRAHEHGNQDLWIETKDTKLTRTDPDFLAEFARYMIEYQELSAEHRFDLHIVVRYLRAPEKWERIFKVVKQKDEAVKDFYHRVKDDAELDEAEKEKFNSYPYEEFDHFVTEVTTVHQMSPAKVQQATEELERSDRYEHDTFTEKREPINKREELRPNFAEINSPPENIYIGDVEVPNFFEGVTNLIDDTEAVRFRSNKVFSLLPPEDFPDYVESVVEIDTVSAESFDDWATDEENTDLASSLLTREICRQNVEKHDLDGCVAFKYRGDYYLMFEHGALEKEVEKVQGQQVSRVFSDASSKFVRHRTAQLNVRRLNDDYFLFVLIKDHFTENGDHMTLIRGDRKGSLHDNFAQHRYNNSQTYSRYNHWRKILSIHNRARDTSGQIIGFRRITEISIGKRPAGTREEIDTRDTDSVQQKLGDHGD
ncbi:hypothetical protein [Halopenitus persicus]|uniref:hypothetical protein n=1 Tax=Halopenitus persicus TaxID=1048396 RepID=UPI000BBB656E|nr:hypothetical protein [Halopenitus persicus]